MYVNFHTRSKLQVKVDWLSVGNQHNSPITLEVSYEDVSKGTDTITIFFRNLEATQDFTEQLRSQVRKLTKEYTDSLNKHTEERNK